MCTHLHFTHMILLYIPDQPWAYVTRYQFCEAILLLAVLGQNYS